MNLCEHSLIAWYQPRLRNFYRAISNALKVACLGGIYISFTSVKLPAGVGYFPESAKVQVAESQKTPRGEDTLNSEPPWGLDRTDKFLFGIFSQNFDPPHFMTMRSLDFMCGFGVFY